MSVINIFESAFSKTENPSLLPEACILDKGNPLLLISAKIYCCFQQLATNTLLKYSYTQVSIYLLSVLQLYKHKVLSRSLVEDLLNTPQ